MGLIGSQELKEIQSRQKHEDQRDERMLDSQRKNIRRYVGGLFIMLGAAVLPLTVPFVIIMLTALFGVHARYGFSSVRLKSISAAGAAFGPVGYEVNLLYITALLALALGGSTPFSVDRWIENHRRLGQIRKGTR